MSKEWNEKQIRKDPWGYHIWLLLEFDKARTWLKQDIDRIRTERNKLAKSFKK